MAARVRLVFQGGAEYELVFGENGTLQIPDGTPSLKQSTIQGLITCVPTAEKILEDENLVRIVMRKL